MKSKETICVFLLLLLAAAVFTWPLIAHVDKAVPSGSEPGAVAYFQLFTMRWTEQALAQPGRYWHARFFHPFAGAFAWCEPQLFNALVVALLARLLGSIAAYNTLILVSMALAGLAGYACARQLTVDRAAAFLSGLWLCAGAFSLQQICAPAIVSAWSLCLVIFFLLQYALTAKTLFVLSAFLCYAISWFIMKQSALSLTLLLPCIFWPWLIKPKKNRHLIAGMIVMLVLTAAVAVPYVAQQWQFTRAMGFERTPNDIIAIQPQSLFIPAQGHWLSWRLLGIKHYSWDIGMAVFLVLAAALVKGFLRKNTLDAQQKKIAAGLATLACAGLLLSFWPRIPWVRIFFTHIPGFTFIRAPGRTMVFTIFALAVMAAPAFAWLRSGMHKNRRGMVTAGVFALAAAEMWTMPIPLVDPREEVHAHQEVIAWLKSHEPSAPVIELPLKSKSNDLEAAAMLRMLEHEHPLVNGYASFTPVPYSQIKQALLRGDRERAAGYLAAYGARYALVHEHLVSGQESAALAAVVGADRVFQGPGHAVYQLALPIYIGKEADFLPLKSDFGARQPAEGKRYAMPLTRALSEARLVYLKGDAIPMEWRAHGQGQTKTLSLRGAVMLEEGSEQLCFRMLRFPDDDRQAEGLLIPCK